MISGITSINTYFNPTVLAAEGLGAGKRSVPVRPTYSLYLFKHVQGVPARSPDRQVPIHKLRALDNVIDRLVKLRGAKGEVMPVSAENVDALIERFEGELHAAFAAVRPLFSGRGGHPARLPAGAAGAARPHRHRRPGRARAAAPTAPSGS